MSSLLRPFAKARPADWSAASPGAGTRVYAIGDIHGRLDLFDRLMALIVADSGARGPVDDHRIILLGDLIDRGPDSAGVVEWAIAMRRELPGFTCLMGNHEAMLVDALAGDLGLLRHFAQGIGYETLLSYGLSDIDIMGPVVPLHALLLERIPDAHRDFLRQLPDIVRLGDYFFVHAGVRPGVALDRQKSDDLRWIRGDFLRSARDHGAMIVHGHSIVDLPEMLPNRIGIDTGAYASGRLTALGLEGTERWLLST